MKIAFWIQVSGASALAVGELSSPLFQPGQPSDVVFDDLDGIAEIRSLVRTHASRVVDNFLLDASKENPSIKTALVLPPIIYGAGEGPVNQRSVQVPTLCKVALERGKAVQLGKGEGRWGNVHVRDLGPLFVALAEAGAKGNQDDAIWGDNGIYLTGVGEIVGLVQFVSQTTANPIAAMGEHFRENRQGGSRKGSHQHCRSRANRRSRSRQAPSCRTRLLRQQRPKQVAPGR